MAYCCAAALLVALIIALSRSAPQYSHPMLLRCVVASWQRSWQEPSRQAFPVVGSQVVTRSAPLPSWRQSIDCCPWQSSSSGRQAVHLRRALAHTWPLAEQSVTSVQTAAPPASSAHFWILPSAQRCAP